MPNGLAPKHLRPEDHIIWDSIQLADWEVEEALRFAPGTHPLDQASFFVPHGLCDWQADAVLAGCRNHSNAIISTANESGKTSVIIPVFGLGLMNAFPGAQVYSTSGDEKQVKEQLFELQLRPRVEKKHMKKAGWKIKTGDSMKVTSPNGSSWLGYVSQRDSTAEGFHGYWQFDEEAGEKRYCPCIYIVDEAKSVGDGFNEAIGRIDPDFRINVSTPGKESGWFYEGIDPETLRVNTEDCSNIAAWNKYEHPYEPNPLHDYQTEWSNTENTEMFTYRRMVSWEDCAHLHTEKKKIARLKAIKKYGANSAYVKSFLYGQFQRSEDFNLIYTDEDLDLMKKAMRGEMNPIGKDVMAAGDVSGGGDGQVLDLRIGTEIALHDDHNCGTGIEQAEYWVALLNSLDIDPWQFNMDSAGLGAEVANYMEKRLNYCGINRIQANVGAQFKFEFRDKYTEIHFRVKELLSAGVLKLPYNENLLKQMRCRRFIEMDSHKFKTEDKKAHRKREKSSPDELDNLVYVFWEFPWHILDAIAEQREMKEDPRALTEMEKKARAGSKLGNGAFGNMRSASSARESFSAGQMRQKLRIGRR